MSVEINYDVFQNLDMEGRQNTSYTYGAGCFIARLLKIFFYHDMKYTI